MLPGCIRARHPSRRLWHTFLRCNQKGLSNFSQNSCNDAGTLVSGSLSRSPAVKVYGCLSPGEQIENAPAPRPPGSVRPALRKRSSFLSCGLDTVSALRKVRRTTEQACSRSPAPKSTMSPCTLCSDTRPRQRVSRREQQRRLGILR